MIFSVSFSDLPVSSVYPSHIWDKLNSSIRPDSIPQIQVFEYLESMKIQSEIVDEITYTTVEKIYMKDMKTK